MKPGNKVILKGRFTARGLQILTGQVSARANDVPAGVYHAINEADGADDYAKGERVVLKFYLRNVRFEKQGNPDLKELTVWLTPDQFRALQAFNPSLASTP